MRLHNPTEETWNNAYSIILQGGSFMTLWQAVIAVDPTFPCSGPVEDADGNRIEGWERIPDQFTIARAIKSAVQGA